MSKRLLVTLLIVIFPSLVLGAGSVIGTQISNRSLVKKQHRAAKLPLMDRISLGLRPYGVEAVKRHWVNPLNDDARAAERRFLQFDRNLAAAVAIALFLCLFITWRGLGQPFPLVYLLVPAIALLLADWTENRLLIGQLDRLLANPPLPLQPGQIRRAAMATLAKLVLYLGLYITLLRLAVRAYRSAGG
jgi:hypothetical protein